MKLNFLGSGSAFYPVLRNTSAYMEKDDELFLLDCGESVYELLFNSNILDKVNKVYVLITHLHADHVGSLGSLISYLYCLREKQVNVIHPQKTIVDLLTLEGIDSNGYIYSTCLPENAFNIEATSVEVKHTDDMKCFGYILSDGEDCIYYSGDSASVADEVKELFFNRKIKRVYHDTSTHDVSNPSHCYYGKLEKVFPVDERNRVYCMHLDCDCQELLREKGFRIAGDDET